MRPPFLPSGRQNRAPVGIVGPTTLGIHDWRNQLQVFWINATANSAQMINLQAIIDHPIVETVGLPVPNDSVEPASTFNTDKGVSLVVQRLRPKPTAGERHRMTPREYPIERGRVWMWFV